MKYLCWLILINMSYFAGIGVEHHFQTNIGLLIYIIGGSAAYYLTFIERRD